MSKNLFRVKSFVGDKNLGRIKNSRMVQDAKIATFQANKITHKKHLIEVQLLSNYLLFCFSRIDCIFSNIEKDNEN